MRKICLVGTASSGAGAPFDDPSFEIWGVSARADYVTRADRWMELHCLDGEPPDWAANWRKEMKRFSGDIGEVLMFWPEPDLAPKVTSYPVKRISDRFGTYFMTSTFSWMMALAIDEMRPLNADGSASSFANGDTIMIRGVDMEWGTEYRQQRAGFRHFIEVAKTLGILVDRDVAGGLIWEPTAYPFWMDDPLIQKIERRNADIKNGLNRLTTSLESATLMLAQNRAALIEIDERAKPDYDEAKRRAMLLAEMKAVEDSASKWTEELIAHHAVDAEQMWFADYLRS